MVKPPPLIAKRSLLVSHVPQVDVRTLDTSGWSGDGASAREWARVWEFALTFNGWRYFGDDEDVIGRLGDFDRSVKKSYLEYGKLPAIDLALLRACLFFEQRLWCKHSMEGPAERDKAYLHELLEAIRRELR